MTRSIVLLIGFTAVIMLSLAAVQGLRVPLKDLVLPLAFSALLGAVALFYHYCRPTPAFVLCCSALAVLIVFSTLFSMLTYAVAATGRPYADPLLASVDSSVGVSAGEVVRWVNARPYLSMGLKMIYFSIIPQSILAIAYFGLKNSPALTTFLYRFVLCALVTVILFYALPAKGSVASFDVPVPDYYQPILEHLDGLREGSRTTVSWKDAEGIITFPSFHTIWGVLLIVLFWPTRLRWPMAVLNSVMILSTVTTGMHYAADVLGGLLVTGFVIALDEHNWRKTKKGVLATLTKTPC